MLSNRQAYRDIIIDLSLLGYYTMSVGKEVQTLITYEQVRWRNIPGGLSLKQHHCKKLKSCRL